MACLQLNGRLKNGLGLARMSDGPIYRSWGEDPLPSRDVALASPLRAFKSWYLRMECGKCGRPSSDAGLALTRH